MLSHGTQKSLWWFALAAACGVMLIIVTVVFETIIHREPWRLEDWKVLGFFFVVNLPLGVVAVLRLRGLYKKYPPRWRGRWQIGLGDIMGIVFLFGLTLTLFQAFVPNELLSAGVPSAFYFWFGFLGALLFVSRVGMARGLDRWVDAMLYVLLAIMTMVTGIIVDLIVFGLPVEIFWPHFF